MVKSWLQVITAASCRKVIHRTNWYKCDGKGNYTLGIQEQIIFPEINIDSITRILGMNITFVTSAQTDEEGYALLKEFGLPFKNAKKD